MRSLALVMLAACSFEPRGVTDPAGDATDATSDDGRRDPDAADVDAALVDARPTDAALVDAALVDARPTDAPLVDAPTDAPPRCVGYQAVPNTPATSRYRKVNTRTLWVDALTDCTSDGGLLVIPQTNAEATAVYAFVNPAGSSPFYWAGISDLGLDGTWTTLQGLTFVNPPFAPGQPDARPGEFYILVGSTGLFYDWFDNGAQEYACECLL